MSDQLQYTISADDGPAKQALDRVKEQFSGLNAHVGNITAGIQSSLGRMQAGLLAVMGVLAGGKLFADSTRAAAAYDGQVAGLAKTLGVTTAEASRINVALRSIGKTSDDLTSASMKLLRQVNANESGLNALGLKTRDSSGNLLSMMQLMTGGLDVLRSYKEGADRDSVALQMFGKSAQEVMGLQKLTGDELARGAELAEKYGLVIDGKNVEAAKKFKRAQDELKIASEALSIKIGNTLLPMLNTLAHVAMVDIPAAFAAAGRSFNQWADDVVTRAEPIRQSLHKMVAGVEELLDRIRPQWLKDMKKDQAAAQEAYMGRKFEGAANDRRESTRFDEQAAAARNTDTGGKRAPPPGGGSTKPESRIAVWEQRLNEQKEAHEKENAENGTFYEFSKQQELEFWKAKQAILEKGAAEGPAVQKRITATTIEIRKEEFDARIAQLKREEAEAEQNFTVKRELAGRELVLMQQAFGAQSKQAEEAQRHIVEIERQARQQRMELRRMEIDEIAANGQQQIEVERQQLRMQQELGVVDRAQVLQAEEAFEQRRYAIQQQALQQRLQMVDPDKNPVEAARLKDQMLEIERQYQLRLSELRNQSQLENAKYTLQAVSSLQQGLEGVFSKIGTQIKSVGQLVQGVFQMMAQVAINMLAQIAAKWIAQQILMKIFGKATALGAIAGESAKAGAGGVASMAAAPFPLNLSAPAFGAAMAAAAMAYAPMASASAGFDIPSGVNPVTQLHQREMVLPEAQADVIRGLAGQGGGRGGPVYLTVQAMDGASVRRVLMDNPDALAEALSTARRRGHL